MSKMGSFYISSGQIQLFDVSLVLSISCDKSSHLCKFHIDKRV